MPLSKVFKNLSIYIYGSRSNKSIDYLQKFMGNKILDEIKIFENDWSIEFEYNMPCKNFSSKKKCDIVLSDISDKIC